jgi:hypothetical protein
MENCHEQLEKLINFFAKTQTNAQTFFVPDAETFKKSFWQETEKVKTAMNGKSLIAGTTGNLELLVHQHQAAIALWLDTIFDADIKKSSNCSGDLASFAIEELEKLLRHFYHGYEVYFNLDERLPEFSLKQFRLSLRGRLSKVRNHLVKECGNEALAELALLPLREFLGDSGNKKISYHFLFYCRRIEKALSTFCNETYSGKEFDDKPLIRLMVRMNYNNQETVDFIVCKIMRDKGTWRGNQSGERRR